LAGFYNGAFDAPSRLNGGDLDKNVISRVGISTSNILDVKFPRVSPPTPRAGKIMTGA